MQIKVDSWNEQDLKDLARLNRRSPTAESNEAIAYHLERFSRSIVEFRLSPASKNYQREREKKKIRVR